MKNIRIFGLLILTLAMPTFIIGEDQPKSDPITIQEISQADQEAEIKKQTIILDCIMNGAITSESDGSLSFNDGNQTVTETVDKVAKLVHFWKTKRINPIEIKLSEASTPDEFEKIIQNMTPQEKLDLKAQEFCWFVVSAFTTKKGPLIPLDIRQNRRELIMALEPYDFTTAEMPYLRQALIIAAAQKPLQIDSNSPSNTANRLQETLKKDILAYEKHIKELEDARNETVTGYIFVTENRELFSKCFEGNNLECRKLGFKVKSDPAIDTAIDSTNFGNALRSLYPSGHENSGHPDDC